MKSAKISYQNDLVKIIKNTLWDCETKLQFIYVSVQTVEKWYLNY